ncbi:MAG: hypothetical protein JWL81_2470 [Verrucomicrobiales bacterium]|nr:hypothetical protein [Verrucomicrobiales bacterium]
MKKPLALASLVIALVTTLSCEQQSYDQTKMFNQNRHAHGAEHGAAPEAGAHGAAPSDAHGVKTDAHAPAAAH